MRKYLIGFVLFFLFVMSSSAQAAYVSRFDAMIFHPVTDNSSYFSVYGAQTLEKMNGHLGLIVDYANRPLQFTGTGGFLGTRQSVIDHMVTGNFVGGLGFTDWFNVGVRMPIAFYNWFYSDEPVAAPTGNADKAGMPGDLEFLMKFRLIDVEEHGIGLALIPHITIPTGDETRYTGSGNLTGGGKIAFEFFPHKRFSIAINPGVNLRDDVTRHGVVMGNQITLSSAVAWEFVDNWIGIVEGWGFTTFDNLMTRSNSPIEAGAGVRHIFGDSGVTAGLGSSLGLINGVGSPRFRAFGELRWSPTKKEVLPPDPRIQGNKIVLWGKIFYDTAKATIKPISFPVLDDVVDVMQKNSNVQLVEVQGHCDHRGSDDYNMKLSQARAESAMNYLVQKGVDSSRLRAKGYGESQPIATNETKEGMSQNRRTEFIIVSSSDGSITEIPPADGTTSEPAAAPEGQ